MKWKILRVIFTIPIFPIFLVGLFFERIIIPFGEGYLRYTQNFFDWYADNIESLTGYSREKQTKRTTDSKCKRTNDE